ncbi:MAG: protein phosphatase 2C domain-containing protein [Planctomycetota bacterium]|nr:protein phosphatase 2C domain-containing protein [Planctomycetota bacterium]
MTTPHQLMCLGKDHGQYGEVHIEDCSAHNAVAITVGSDRESPSKKYKGDKDNQNEDALFVYDDGENSVLAVADAHFGWSSSHDLIELLRQSINASLPKDAQELADRVAQLHSSGSSFPNSDTTLVIAIHNRKSKSGFGLSFGDSTIALIGPQQSGAAVNPHNTRYVSPERSQTLEAQRATLFQFKTQARDLILAFTDGIDECNYRHAEFSLQPEHLLQLYGDIGCHPRKYATALVEWALRGVDGHPGGQDNIALIVTEA